MTERLPTYDGFRDYLWDVLPEARRFILEEESYCVSDDDVPGTYTLVSAFRQVLDGAAESDDLPLVRRCLTLLERMLVDGDVNLQDAVQIRVLDKDGLTTELPPLYQRYAGPQTRLGLSCCVGDDRTYLPPDWPVPVPPVADGRPGGRAQAARGWLWRWAPESRSGIIEAEQAALVPEMSLAAMTPERYFEVALHHLLEHAVERARIGDPQPVDDVMTMLTMLVMDPDMAPLLHRHIGELTDCLVLQVYAGTQLTELLTESG